MVSYLITEQMFVGHLLCTRHCRHPWTQQRNLNLRLSFDPIALMGKKWVWMGQDGIGCGGSHRRGSQL